jgi:hypothetical protein
MRLTLPLASHAHRLVWRIRESLARYTPLSIGVALLTVAACKDQTGPQKTFTTIEDAWVTPSIAAQLDLGLFPGNRPEIASPREVSLDAARTLANAWVKTVGVVSASIWSDDAGVTVLPAQLVQCNRIDYVESAYEEIPATRSQAFRNAWGSQWLVRFCQNGSAPVVEVSVAANATTASVGKDGRLDGESVNAAFNDHGIAQNSKQYPSVEDGARHVATANARAGSRIAELPKITRAGRGTPPWIVSWIFTQTDAAAVRSRVSVFGASKTALITRPVQDITAESDTLVDVSPAQNGTSIPVVIKRRANALQISDVLLFLSQPRG